MVVVFSADQVTQARLGFLPLTPDQAGTMTGSLATLLFVAATLASVNAQAANQYEVPQVVIEKLLAGRIDKADRTAEWDKTSEKSYQRVRILWINGVSLFLLTLGTLAYGEVRAELVVAGAIATATGLLNVSDNQFRKPGFVLLSLVVLIVSGIAGAAAGWAIWS
jgi:hypothetical protein